ncbi:hypothetical protein TNCV_746771 [Trichonephila clavipes]|nr:hypothetical protein TNCV_746771 [Trichonephila clavipes]
MSEEKLIDHVVSRLEPQILDYVEVRHPQNTANLLQINDKYEERFMNRQIRALCGHGSGEIFYFGGGLPQIFSIKTSSKDDLRVVKHKSPEVT